MTEQTSPESPYLPFIPASGTVSSRLPEGSCDCHFHIFEDVSIYPLAPLRSYTPTEAPMAEYRRMLSILGVTRAVLVHPSVYGRDHRSFEHALQEHGSWLRGVAVVYSDTAQHDIARWDALGARGTRCNAVFAGGTSLSEMKEIAARVRDFGWHLQLLVDVDADPKAVAQVADLGLPVVVDHFGHTAANKALNSRGFANLCALLREGQVWVKLSGAYRITNERGLYPNVAPLADALLSANPKRLVWGSDWPHPSISAPMPDDIEIMEALLHWVPKELLNQILVDNPENLYWSR